VVSFKAFYRQDGEEHVMNEISRFTKINGRWFYLDGVIKSIVKVGLLTN
jgi:SEC-C motif domain protein